MARFFGEVGFAESKEIRPGVWDDIIVEKKYYGDIVRNSRRFQDGQTITDNVSVENSVSIVADAYASGSIDAMRYVRWMGTLWEISTVEVQSPRLTLRLGGVYNGPKAATP